MADFTPPLKAISKGGIHKKIFLPSPSPSLASKRPSFTFYPSSSNQNVTSTKKRRRHRPPVHENVGTRLATRKQLFTRRRYLADLCFGLAMFGFLLGVIVAELHHLRLLLPGDNNEAASLYPELQAIATVLKWIISISTVVLLITLLFYHETDVRIFLLDNCNFHPLHFHQPYLRIAVTPRRVVRVMMELCVCIVHPPPWGEHRIPWEMLQQQNTPSSVHRVPLDVVLVLLMSTRVYLLGRVVLLHSSLFQGSCAQSLGALNKVSFNVRFVFKSLMNVYPEHVLTGLIVGVLLWSSWAMRACEMYTRDFHDSFLQSFWLISITFLTVGYGDIVPATYCGRSVAVVSGVFGAFITALVVAVLARKLELSHSEKHVQDYVINLELGKGVKHCAANIIRESWLAFKYQRQANGRQAQIHTGQLMASITHMQDLKERQRRQIDNSLDIREIYRMQKNLERSLDVLRHQLDTLNENVLAAVFARR